jgi:hypothetical protein
MPCDSNSRSLNRHLLNCVSISSFQTGLRGEEDPARLAELQSRVSSMHQRFEQLQRSKASDPSHGDLEVTKAILSLRRENPPRPRMRSGRENDHLENIHSEISQLEKQMLREKGEVDRLTREFARKESALLLERERLQGEIERLRKEAELSTLYYEDRFKAELQQLEEEHLDRMQHIEENLQFAVTEINRKTLLLGEKDQQLQDQAANHSKAQSLL